MRILGLQFWIISLLSLAVSGQSLAKNSCNPFSPFPTYEIEQEFETYYLESFEELDELEGNPDALAEFGEAYSSGLQFNLQADYGVHYALLNIKREIDKRGLVTTIYRKDTAEIVSTSNNVCEVPTFAIPPLEPGEYGIVLNSFAGDVSYVSLDVSFDHEGLSVEILAATIVGTAIDSEEGIQITESLETPLSADAGSGCAATSRSAPSIPLIVGFVLLLGLLGYRKYLNIDLIN